MKFQSTRWYTYLQTLEYSVVDGAALSWSHLIFLQGLSVLLPAQLRTVLRKSKVVAAAAEKAAAAAAVRDHIMKRDENLGKGGPVVCCCLLKNTGIWYWLLMFMIPQMTEKWPIKRSTIEGNCEGPLSETIFAVQCKAQNYRTPSLDASSRL